MKKERLLILGASVRAAAQSAAAAGYEVIAADQFADRDLREICPEARPVRYPDGLLDFAMRVEPCAWMYTGGLENYPEIVEKISERHELLGNGPEVLTQVRDPRELATLADGLAPYSFPKRCVGNRSRTKRWLIKRTSSAGGLGIRFADETTELKPGEMIQEYVEGTHASLTFLAGSGTAKLLFSTVQFRNLPILGAPAFSYCGGVSSPLVHPIISHFKGTRIEEIGTVLANDYSVRGVFGVDIVIGTEQIWLLEVNPRFTASMGLFERFFYGSLVGYHLQACREKQFPEWKPRSPVEFRAIGILYARADCHITERMADRLWSMRSELDLADMPMGGSAISKGCPVLTVFAKGESQDVVVRQLEGKIVLLRALGIP